jgi:predicted helicase
MPTDHRSELAKIHTFPSLVRYLRDEMDWPIEADDFDEVTFEYSPEELGIDAANAAKIQEIKRLRPLSAKQPWGIFFVKFEPKKLPVVALRRILSQVALKKRASANSAERAAWATDDLLFISTYGVGDERQISFAHFSQAPDGQDLPTLKVLGWDNRDTPLHFDAIARALTEHLTWPSDLTDINEWRSRWRAAFTLRHGEVIRTSKDLSIRLADLAKAIRDRINTALAIETETGPLTQLMKVFKEALVHDLDADGFADMYAQTIAYGLLSARIADPEKKTADDFAGHMRTNPFLRELMETFLKVGGRRGRAGGPGIDFDELGVSEVVDLLDTAKMEAVIQDFGDKNRQEDPVIHFYELFLSAYDKQLKVQRGVFYTPQSVVSYIVRSAHERLQTEFGLADGLGDTTTWGEMVKIHPALKLPPLTDKPGEERTISPDEPFVQILDPATGTATFLVEVIDVIYHTLTARWKQQHLTDAQQGAAWNEYVPKHLLPRLHAYELMMAPYAIAHMKLGLKLHETGYRFGTEERARIYLTNALEPWLKQLPLIGLAALAHEAAAVNEIKRHKRFTVVIGNPPYSKSSQNQGEWIESLMEEYKRTVRSAETQIQALSDDYAKFLRFGQFMLEVSNTGVLSFITNNSYLDGPLFRDMRSSMLRFFQTIYILNLHGDTRKQFLPPEGTSDVNVFDIQQGVAISALSRPVLSDVDKTVRYSDLWGTRQEKYAALTDTSQPKSTLELEPTQPFYLFVPVTKDLEAEFHSYWHLYDVFGTGNQEVDNHESYGAGFVTQQDSFAIGFAKEDVASNVEEFLNPRAKNKDLWEKFGFCSTNQWDFDRAKRELKKIDIQRATKRCLYRPFDFRFTVFDRNICTILRKRITSQFDHKNVALLATRRVTRLPFNNVFVSNTYTEYKVASHDRNTIVFPLWIYPSEDNERGIFEERRRENLNPAFVRELASTLNTVRMAPEDIFHYVYAVLHSPGYRSRYAEFLKIDFPRLPLQVNLELFQALVRLGSELVTLHLLESPKLAQPNIEFVGGRNPEVEKILWSDEAVWIDKAQTTGFRGVIESVWDFHVGGYQVCEKWLKDRKGRTLSHDDIIHYRKIVVAISETIGLMKEIDEVIESFGGWPDAFLATKTPETPMMHAAEVAS